MELENFEQKWGTKYPYAIRSWRNNWEELTVFFDFPVEIRKIIYTTNLIENLNGKIRKYTKNKLSFPNDDALKKSVYLAITEIEKKWYQPIWNWALIFNQFITIFENRIRECNLNSVWFLFLLNHNKYNFFFLDLQMLLKVVFGCVQGRRRMSRLYTLAHIRELPFLCV